MLHSQFFRELDINLKLKSARRFKTERFESLKNVSKHCVIKKYNESFSSVAFKRCLSHLRISILSSTEVQIHSLKGPKTVLNSQIS